MNEMRLSEYEHYRCNEAIFSTSREDIPDICKKYRFSISVNVHGGAYGKLQI